MSTRFFFAEAEVGTGTPTVSATDWGHIPDPVVRRRLLLRVADASTLATVAYTPDGADHTGAGTDLNAHHRQYLSDPLAAQSLSGTVTAQLQALEANANNNLQLTLRIYTVDEAGAALTQSILTVTRKGTEPTTSLRNTQFAAETIASITIAAGERIVVEVGLGGQPASGSGTNAHNGSIRWGGAASSGDLPADESQAGTTYRPWIEFSATLNRGFAASAAAGTPGYALTSTDEVVLKAALKVVDEGAAYDVTGDGAMATLSVPVNQLDYAFTVDDVTLTYTPGAAAYTLEVAEGTADLTGAAVGLVAGWLVEAVTDTFTLTGDDLTPEFGGVVEATPETYSLTGDEVVTAAGWMFAVDEATPLTLTGDAVEFVKGYGLEAVVDVYALTAGDEVVVRGAFVCGVDTTEILLTGADVGLTFAQPKAVAADPELYSLMGELLDLVYGRTVAVEAGQHQVWGDEASVLAGHALEAESDTYTHGAGAALSTGLAPISGGGLDPLVLMRRRRRR